MRHAHWKDNWAESRQHYLDWWDGKGLVVSMWEHLLVDGPPHEVVPAAAAGPRPQPVLV